MSNFAGGGNFAALGQHNVDLLIDLAGLKDGHAVLDIGCAIGRNAIALDQRLPNLRYCGFDIVAYGITWCQKRFRDKTNFRFLHSDIYNSFYNPRGALRADQYRFDYPDEAFDIVFATSVFTHMPVNDVDHYLAESSRCLKQGGIGYFTCFILDDDARRSIDAGKSDFNFRFPIDRGWTEREFEPDVAVAFENSVFLKMIKASRLAVLSFVPGRWRGISSRDYQDTFILRQPSVTA